MVCVMYLSEAMDPDYYIWRREMEVIFKCLDNPGYKVAKFISNFCLILEFGKVDTQQSMQ